MRYDNVQTLQRVKCYGIYYLSQWRKGKDGYIKMNELIIGVLFCGGVMVLGLFVSICECIAAKNKNKKNDEPLYNKKRR